MKKNSTVFIDASAWIAVLDEQNPNHVQAREYYKKLIEQSARLVTNNIVIDECLSVLKEKFGNEFAQQFLETIDESVLSVTLRVDWISRRIRRNVINNFLKTSSSKHSMRQYYVYESIKRKKVDIVFSYDENLKAFDFPVMPQNV